MVMEPSNTTMIWDENDYKRYDSEDTSSKGHPLGSLLLGGDITDIPKTARVKSCSVAKHSNHWPGQHQFSDYYVLVYNRYQRRRNSAGRSWKIRAIMRTSTARVWPISGRRMSSFRPFVSLQGPVHRSKCLLPERYLKEKQKFSDLILVPNNLTFASIYFPKVYFPKMYFPKVYFPKV